MLHDLKIYTGFLRMVNLTVSFSTASDITLKIKKSYFKVKFLNFANFKICFCEQSTDWQKIWTQASDHQWDFVGGPG